MIEKIKRRLNTPACHLWCRYFGHNYITIELYFHKMLKCTRCRNTINLKP